MQYSPFSMTRWVALLLVAFGVLAGCDDGVETTTDIANQDEQRVISGKVMYRERIAMPQGATVSVTLADVSRADAPAKVIAEQHIDNPGQVPVPFELPYLTAAITQTHPLAYAVRAEIRGRDGRLLWTTTQRHAVEPGADEPPSELTVMVKKVSAVQQPDLSPAMIQAKEQGATFWAAGNEPGWHLAVYPAERLEFVGDYGNTQVSVPQPEVLADGTETRYQASNEDHALKVEISPSSCQDTMSGSGFNYTVTVSVDDQTFHGCGLDL